MFEYSDLSFGLICVYVTGDNGVLVIPLSSQYLCIRSFVGLIPIGILVDTMMVCNILSIIDSSVGATHYFCFVF